MEIYILKEQFIKDACKADKQFKTKIDRPYLCVLVIHQSRKYLMPLSHTGSSIFCYKVTDENFIHFDKCFELRNISILKSKYVILSKKDRELIKNLETKQNTIYQAFIKYLKIHPTKWSVDIKLLSDIQDSNVY